MFTPNRRAPPEATSPGRMVSIRHSRSPASATAPGITASTVMPRRSGTERQTAARSMRSIIKKSDAAVGRAGKWPDSSRSSSRIGRCSAHLAGMAPTTTEARPIAAMTSRPSAHRHQWPAWVSRSRTSSCEVGLWSRTGASEPVTIRAPRARAKRTHQDAEGPDAVPAPAYSLGQPADDLGQGRRGHDPEQDGDLVGPHARGPEGVRRRAEQQPGLHDPGDVQGREQQGAEMVGRRRDREGHRLRRGAPPRGLRRRPPR